MHLDFLGLFLIEKKKQKHFTTIDHGIDLDIWGHPQWETTVIQANK